MTAPEKPMQLKAALAGRRAWLISDGKAGNEAQARGVLEAMGVAWELVQVEPRGLLRLIAPYGRPSRSKRASAPSAALSPPWPDFAVAAGRLTIPYIRDLRRRAGLATYTVVLLDPRTGTGTADLIWVPEHDKRRGPNVITTMTAPHSFSPERLAEFRARPEPAWLAALPHPRIAVLLGGPSKVHAYSDAAITRLTATLAGLQRQGAGLMITASRRSPAALVTAAKALVRDGGGYLWDGSGENPLPFFYACADCFIVPGDSINMTGEPCVTGRPVHVFMPDGGSPKFQRFHEALIRQGATRPLGTPGEALAAWRYPPLYSASAIAAEIEKRWSRRHGMLSGLVPPLPG